MALFRRAAASLVYACEALERSTKELVPERRAGRVLSACTGRYTETVDAPYQASNHRRSGRPYNPVVDGMLGQLIRAHESPSHPARQSKACSRFHSDRCKREFSEAQRLSRKSSAAEFLGNVVRSVPVRDPLVHP